MAVERWAVCKDDLVERVFDLSSDVVGAHYFGFEGKRENVLDQMAAAFREIVSEMIYRANDYGHEWTPEDDDDEEAPDAH